MKTILRVWVLCALGAATVPTAFAGKEKPVEMTTEQRAAEVRRLEAEMARLARRTHWSGVERVYREMLELHVPLATHTHYTAALGAESRGDMRAMWVRLERALGVKSGGDMVIDSPEVATSLPEQVDVASESGQAARAAYEHLQLRYGRVDVSVHRSRVSALALTSPKPFSKNERAAIESARESVRKHNAFAGLLPVGKYMIDGQFFEISAGEFLEVRIEKH